MQRLPPGLFHLHKSASRALKPNPIHRNVPDSCRNFPFWLDQRAPLTRDTLGMA